jgi:hypothetical protein
MKSDKTKSLGEQLPREENFDIIDVIIESSVTKHKIVEKTVSF